MAQESILINAQKWGRRRGEYAPVFRHDMLRSSETLPVKMKAVPVDLHLTQSLLFGYPNVLARRQSPGAVMAAIDPDVNSFVTTLEPMDSLESDTNECADGSDCWSTRCITRPPSGSIAAHVRNKPAKWSRKSEIRLLVKET